LAVGKGNLSHSLTNLEDKGLVTISRTPGGNPEAVELNGEISRRACQEVANKEPV
jgi:hypothetical protein